MGLPVHLAAQTVPRGRLLPGTTVLSLAFKSTVDMCTVIPTHLAAVISVQAATRGKEPLPAVRDNLYKAKRAKKMVEIK